MCEPRPAASHAAPASNRVAAHVETIHHSIFFVRFVLRLPLGQLPGRAGQVGISRYEEPYEICQLMSTRVLPSHLMLTICSSRDPQIRLGE